MKGILSFLCLIGLGELLTFFLLSSKSIQKLNLKSVTALPVVRSNYDRADVSGYQRFVYSGNNLSDRQSPSWGKDDGIIFDEAPESRYMDYQTLMNFLRQLLELFNRINNENRTRQPNEEV